MFGRRNGDGMICRGYNLLSNVGELEVDLVGNTLHGGEDELSHSILSVINDLKNVISSFLIHTLVSGHLLMMCASKGTRPFGDAGSSSSTRRGCLA